MIKKILTALLGAAMIVFTILAASGTSAYPDDSDIYGNPGYYYYGQFYEYDTFNSIPIVAGPFPRYYLSHYQDGTRSYFLHDDFNHFDNYVGYRDLDVFKPDGTIDVLRNPQGTLEAVDPDYVLTYRQQTGGYNVYGSLPGGSVYRKHYYHEHPFELEEYGYYDYMPVRNYAVRPVYRNRCTSVSCH
jgi:hypothetical protein